MFLPLIVTFVWYLKFWPFQQNHMWPTLTCVHRYLPPTRFFQCLRGLEAHLMMWGGTLPAGILILLAVNKWAGIQLAAHYRGAVVTHGWVPGGALGFRVTVDARDCREREQKTRCESESEVMLLIVGLDQNEREKQESGSNKTIHKRGF